MRCRQIQSYWIQQEDCKYIGSKAQVENHKKDALLQCLKSNEDGQAVLGPRLISID